ncbi:MAG: pseudaminic acid synthase [Gammaproteobacteria bacterium]|nr:pseudaminic acid synthase [Gammaproteobacteria bacterium]
MTIRIGRHVCGPDHVPLVIAELSGNHNGSLERALRLVEAAAAAGVQAIKLQTYTADTMTLDLDRDEFFIADPDSPWAGKSLYRLYQEAHTPWDWHATIFARARALGMAAFSTPFDASAVDFLEQLDVPCYKIASFENVDLPLIRRVATTGKPVIISTGMATREEITAAVDAARAAGCRELVLLKCTSSYPASPADSNLATLPDLRARYGCEVGLSDHTAGIGAAVAAVALGATVIEKHLTLARADGGVDAAFSLEPEELRRLVEETARARAALGTVHYGLTAAEQGSRVFRRSLYITADLPAGAVLTADTVRAIRPGLGLPPGCLDAVLGRRLRRAVPRGTPVSWDLLD